MSISSVDSGPLHVKPVVDLNLTTEANRILFVLNKVIWRAEFAGLLKVFLKNNGLVMQDVLEPSTHYQVLQKCSPYNQDFSSRASDSSSTAASSSKGSRSNQFPIFSDEPFDLDDEDDESEDDSGSSFGSEEKRYLLKRKHDGLTSVIYMLEENSEMRKKALNMKHMLSPEMKFFVKSLIEFREWMKKRLSENATQYKTRERYMREVYEKNEAAKKEIERLEEELLVTKTDANVCLIGRNILIKRHQNKIEKVQKKSQEAIEIRVNESEKSMVNSWKVSAIKQEQLEKDFQQATEKYSNLLKDHMAVEKVLRSKRAKVENQVLGWIQKFDQDIGEKQAEEEEIQGLLDNELDAVNEIQKKLDEQEEEYDELMQEKAEYEEEMLERRLYHFIVNRSARRIQRTYRLYKARKLAKKMAKKGKKGKKK